MDFDVVNFWKSILSADSQCWMSVITGAFIAFSIPFTIFLRFKDSPIFTKFKKKKIANSIQPQQQLQQHQASPIRHIDLSASEAHSFSNSDDDLIDSPTKSQGIDEDDDIESDIMNELDLYHATKGEKPGMEGLASKLLSSTPQHTLNQEQFEKIQSLEQELANQKLLSHYTELRLAKKEKECSELHKSEQNARKKVKELMDEIASISKKNTDLMSYCETKVAYCRVEYERISKKLFVSKQKVKKLEKECVDLKERLSENAIFRRECTKLRANVSTLKSQIRENQKVTVNYKKEIKSLQEVIDGKKHRLSETSKHFSKVNDDLIWYKHENKIIKGELAESKEKLNELELCNVELMDENEEVKKQISRFSKQLQKQSRLQNEIIDIQQQLTNKQSPLLLSSSSRGSVYHRDDLSDIPEVREDIVIA